MNDKEINPTPIDDTDTSTPQVEDDLGCYDENGQWKKLANTVVDRLTPTEIENIKANSGLDGTKKDNCEDLGHMVCDLQQEVEWVGTDTIRVVAPNEASKCKESTDPTLASMWSRILRFADAASAIMCAYDPYVATILKMGKYPQILMGAAQEGGYPTWVDPDNYPELESKRPVTSEGIIKAIKDALLGVWHPWEEEPKFQFFAQTLNDKDDAYPLESQTGAAEGDTALVANDGTHTSALYTYTGGEWVFTKELGEDENLTNFAVTFIEKGYYATKDVYYFDDGTTKTWQVMDADLSVLESRVTELEKVFQNSVLGQGKDEQYVITTRPDLTSAMAVPCTNGKITLTFITG